MSDERPSGVGRRDVLRQSLGLVGVAPLCCSTPELPPGSFRFEDGVVVVDLGLARDLCRTGRAAAIVDAERRVNIIVACTGRGRYAALDRTCTHGGAMCAYQHERRTLRCTSLNHAEYDLDGRLLHGRTHGDLRAYPVRALGARLEIALARRA